MSGIPLVGLCVHCVVIWACHGFDWDELRLLLVPDGVATLRTRKPLNAKTNVLTAMQADGRVLMGEVRANKPASMLIPSTDGFMAYATA